MKKADPFAKAPEFLAAFNNILTNGFFERVLFSAGDIMMEGQFYGCSITASGCVPSNQKYSRAGIGVLFHPEDIIASCKAITGRNKVKSVQVTVKTSDWPLCNKTFDKVIGSKGTRTEMSMHIKFIN